MRLYIPQFLIGVMYHVSLVCGVCDWPSRHSSYPVWLLLHTAIVGHMTSEDNKVCSEYLYIRFLLAPLLLKIAVLRS